MLPNVLISSNTPQPSTASATQLTTIVPIIAPTTASTANATTNTGVTTANTGVVTSTHSREHPTHQEATNVDRIIILPNPDSQGFTGFSDPRRSPNQAPTDGSNSREGNQQETRDRKIDIVCRFYDKGNCLHGITGDTCRYLHPELCRKFPRHGTRQPRGCKLGARCKYFHPTMCLSSLKRGQCFHDQCNYRHVEGTQRIRPSDFNTNQSSPPNQPSYNQNLSSQHHRNGNENYPLNTNIGNQQRNQYMPQQRTQHQQGNQQGNQHPHQHSPHPEQTNSINQHQNQYIPQERNLYQHGNHHSHQHSSQHPEQNRENQQQHIESRQNQKNPGNETASTDHFLELFRHLKAELWTKMNTQFNVLTSQMDHMKASLHGPTLAREQPQAQVPQAQEPKAQQQPQYVLSQPSLCNQQRPSNYQQPQLQFQVPAKIQAPAQIQASGQPHPNLLYSQVAAQQEVQLQKTQQIPLQQYYQYQQTTPFNQIRPMQTHAQC